MPRKRKGPSRPPGKGRGKKGASKKSLEGTTSPTVTMSSPSATNGHFAATDTSSSHASKKRKSIGKIEKNSPLSPKAEKQTSKSKLEGSNNTATSAIQSTMYALPHHTSFIPALQYPNPLIKATNISSTITLNDISNNANASDVNQQDMIANYNLFHPRNLSAQVIPNVTNATTT